jgi:Leucine-rich repeat (LRR) protein
MDSQGSSEVTQTKSRVAKFIDDERRADFYSGRVRELCFHFGHVDELPELPESLEVLDLDFNHLIRLPKLPRGLQELMMYSCHAKVGEYPESLKVLDVGERDHHHCPKLPDGLEELYAGKWEQADVERLTSLRVLSLHYFDFTSLAGLSRELRVLNIRGDDVGAMPVIDWLPPGLKYLKISMCDITRLEILPEGLEFLLLGRSCTAPRAWPEGLRWLEFNNGCAVDRIRNLPPRLKVLRTFCNNIDSICELPASLTRLECAVGMNRLTELPRLPDGLRILVATMAELRGVLEIPSEVWILDIRGTKIEEVVIRGGASSKLTSLNAPDSKLRHVPPLSKDAGWVDVEGCQLQGEWNAHLSGLEHLNCGNNRLTKLPDVPQIKWLRCSHNLLRYLPEGVLTGTGTQCDGNPLDWDIGGEAGENQREFPSLLEISGMAVLAHRLEHAVELVELREFLGEFRECRGCGRKVLLRRKFTYCDPTSSAPHDSPCDESPYNRTPVTWLRCYWCEPQMVVRPMKRRARGDAERKYLAKHGRRYAWRCDNFHNWFESP